MQIVLLLLLALLTQALEYHQMNIAFHDSTVPQQRFEQLNPSYLFPNGHKVREESEEEEDENGDEFFIKRPVLERPYLQKTPSTPPTSSSISPGYQHRLIDDEYFGFIPQSGVSVCGR